MCTGNGALYLWRDSSADWVNDEEVAECVGIPASECVFAPFEMIILHWTDNFVDVGWFAEGLGFTTLDVEWGPDGGSLVLQDRETFACAFVVADEG